VHDTRVAPKSLDTQGGILLGFPIPTQVSEHAFHPNGCDRRRHRRIAPHDSKASNRSRCTRGVSQGRGSDPSAESAKGAQEIGGTDHASHTSRFARLGTWTATHFRRILIAWLLVLMIFGFFAVHVESALAGAGWQASNSQSVAARAIIEKDFAGLGATALQVVVVDHQGPIASDPKALAAVARATMLLRNDPQVSTVVAPQAGVSLSRDGRTA